MVLVLWWKEERGKKALFFPWVSGIVVLRFSSQASDGIILCYREGWRSVFFFFNRPITFQWSRRSELLKHSLTHSLPSATWLQFIQITADRCSSFLTALSFKYFIFLGRIGAQDNRLIQLTLYKFHLLLLKIMFYRIQPKLHWVICQIHWQI